MTGTMMKLTTTLALTFTLCIAAAANGQPVSKYKGNGAYVSVSGYDSSGCRSFYVYVSRGGPTSAPQTYLYYHVYDHCASATAAWGSGTIANADLKVGGKTLTLKTTGADSATFSAQGDAPAFSLTLTKNNGYTESWSGHSRSEYYGHIVQRHGSWTYTSVSVFGTVGGSAVSSGWGATGTGRDHYIEFDRGNK